MNISNKSAKRIYASMIQRSNPKDSIYQGSFICPEWTEFSIFYEWVNEHFVPGWHLDKDLISLGNKEYAPHKCVFIPSYLNHLLSNAASIRGSLPMGVCTGRTKRDGTSTYRAFCRLHGKQISLGVFTTPEDAHRAWQHAKANAIDETVFLYQCESTYDERVCASLHQVRDKLLANANNNTITHSLTL